MDRIEELLIAQLRGDVDRAAIEIELPNGMAGDRRCVANASVILPVRPTEAPDPEEALPARLDEARRQLEVPSLPRRAEQLDEGHLDLG